MYPVVLFRKFVKLLWIEQIITNFSKLNASEGEKQPTCTCLHSTSQNAAVNVRLMTSSPPLILILNQNIGKILKSSSKGQPVRWGFFKHNYEAIGRLDILSMARDLI